MLTFEYAAQNLEDQKLPRQMDTLTEGEQPVENYEMVRSIYNLYTHFKLQFTKKIINMKGLRYEVNIGLFFYHVIVQTKPKQLVKVISAWVRSAFGNVFIIDQASCNNAPLLFSNVLVSCWSLEIQKR